jgi:hypothetical protein
LRPSRAGTVHPGAASATPSPARRASGCPLAGHREPQTASATGTPGALEQRLDRLTDAVQDLAQPIAEITTFDECMYTVGVQQRRGYIYKNRRGSVRERPALSFDMRGHEPAQFDLMAFPGEEPPQIECNEDAAGAGTEE